MGPDGQPEPPYAKAPQRIGAWLLDAGIITVIATGFGKLIGLSLPISPWWGVPLAIVVYPAATLWRPGRTLGESAAGIQTVTSSGASIGPFRAWAKGALGMATTFMLPYWLWLLIYVFVGHDRLAAAWLALLFAPVALGGAAIIYVIMAASGARQTFADIICGTSVVSQERRPNGAPATSSRSTGPPPGAPAVATPPGLAVAPVSERIVAMLFDVLPLAYLFYRAFGGEWFFLAWPVVLVFAATVEASLTVFGKSSLGKLAIGLAVCNADGSEPPLRTRLRRVAVRWVLPLALFGGSFVAFGIEGAISDGDWTGGLFGSYFVLFCWPFLHAFIIAGDSSGRAIHDRPAGTLVVRARELRTLPPSPTAR